MAFRLVISTITAWTFFIPLASAFLSAPDHGIYRRWGPYSNGGGGGGRGYPGYGGDGDGDGNPFSGAGGSNGNGRFGSGSGFNFLGVDLERAMYLRTVHGILAVVAFVVVFPLGAVLMRLIPGRLSVWIHGLVQLLGFATYIAAAGLGIYLARMINFGGQTLFENPQVNFHLIIGLAILAAFILQPVFGVLHHIRYRKLGRRQTWSYFHLWIGRLGIPLGIINGGLGLWIANASNNLKIAYGVIAGLVWCVWMIVAVLSEIRRRRTTRRTGAKLETTITPDRRDRI